MANGALPSGKAPASSSGRGLAATGLALALAAGAFALALTHVTGSQPAVPPGEGPSSVASTESAAAPLPSKTAADFPAACRGFLATRKTRLASVWGELNTRHRQFAPPGIHLFMTAVSFSRDGKQLLSGSLERTARLWDLATGRQVRAFEGHEGGVLAVALSNDGATARTISEDRVLRTFDVASGKEAGRVPVPEVSTVDEVLRSVPGGRSHGCAAFSPDARFAIAGNEGGKVCVHDLADGSQLDLPSTDGPVQAAALAPDGKRVATVSAKGTLELWDLRTERALEGWRPPDKRFVSVALSASSEGSLRVLAGTEGGAISLFELEKSQEPVEHVLGGHQRHVLALAFSPDGRRALSGSRDEARSWDLEKKESLFTLWADGEVEAVAFSPDGKLAAAGCSAGTVRVWDLATGEEKPLAGQSPPPVYALAVTPDGTRAIAAHRDGIVRCWDTAQGQLAWSIVAHRGPVGAVAVATHPDASRPAAVATGGWDSRLKLWSLATGERLREIVTSSGIESLALSPDGKHALAGEWNHPVRIWDTDTGSEVACFEGHEASVHAVAFSADGHRALTGSGFQDRTLRIWDLLTERALATLPGHTNSIRSIAVSQDGSRAITASEDGTLRVWDLSAGKCLAELKGHGREVWSVALSPDGKLAVSAGRDDAIRLWDVASEPPREVDAIDLGTSGYNDRIVVAFMPDGRSFLAGIDAGAILRFELVLR